MPSYTLELELFSSYVTDVPEFEIWADGVKLGGLSYSVTSGGYSISVAPSYGGALPSSLEFRFTDVSVETPRTIEVRSVKINDRYVNTGNYLSNDVLTNGTSATVDITNGDYVFNSSADPAASEFTTGATQTFTTGNDTYNNYGGSTDEVFNMLAGRDYANLGSGDDKASGGAGNDVLRGGAGNDLLFGDADDDRLFGGDDNDRLYGGTGDDRLYGEAGDDELHGGDGDDRLFGHDGHDILTGGIGADKLNGGSGDDKMFGDEDDDQLTGGAGDDTLDGGAGDDLIYGGIGIDHIDGGDDNDILVGNAGNDVINGGAGNDDIYGNEDNDDIYGGVGNDDLYGGDGDDVLIGGADSGAKSTAVEPLINASTVLSYGGTSQDISGTITYLSSGLTIDGNRWKKILVDYTVTANTVIEFDFKSTLEGEVHGIGFDNDNTTDSNATFKVYGEQNWGRNNFDNYDGSGDWNHYTIDVGSYYTGTFSHLFFAGDDDGPGIDGNGSWSNLIIYETTDSGDFDNDDLYGGAGNDTLSGGDGRDNLYGNVGNDTLNGGNGDDVLVGGDEGASSGTNLILNGSFEDTSNGTGSGVTPPSWVTTGAGGGVYAYGAGRGSDGTYAYPIGGWSTSVGGEISQTLTTTLGEKYNLFFDAGVAFGTSATMVLNITDGAASILTDTIIDNSTGGGLGGYYYSFVATTTTTKISFQLTAQTSDTDFDLDNVRLYEALGDTLFGGDGIDSLSGGTGSDVFGFKNATAFSAIDTITDFSLAEGDALDISDLLTGYTPGTHNITNFLQIVDSGSDSDVFVDTTGAGSFAGNQIATITGVTGLTDEANLYSTGHIIIA